MPIITLNENDKNLLQEMLTWWGQQSGRKPPRMANTKTGMTAEGGHMSPEVFIGYPQSAGGIPALTPGSPDVAGVGACDIYKIDDSGGSPELTQISNVSRNVHNLSTDIVPQDYIPIHRTKAGRWITPIPSGMSSDSVMVVEITDSDGSLFSDCYTEVTRQSTDCVFRARIITQDPDTQDLCDRTDVTDGSDVWLKVASAPWCNAQTDLVIGQRFLSHKADDSYTIGLNTFAMYESFMEDSRLWAINPTSDWSSTPHTLELLTIDDTTDTNITPQPIDDPWNLWTNVLAVAGTPPDSQGYGLMMGDEIYPVAMRRRAVEYQANINDSTGMHPDDASILVDGVNVVSESPFIEQPTIITVNNPFRFQCLDDTEIHFERDANQNANYKITNVARSQPILIEIKGSPDGSGQAAELSGSSSLAVWDSRIVTHNPSDGNLRDGGGTAVNNNDIWFGHVGMGVGSGGSSDPPYVSAGQRFLAYDIGKDWTPTGGSARRLYVAPRDSETYYGIAYANWAANSGDPYVDVRPCDDRTGSNPADGNGGRPLVSHRVYLPRHGERDPNVVTGNIITYRFAIDGLWVCVGDYLDAKIGFVAMWCLASGDIPTGWASMDGSANSSGNGGSGIVLNTGGSDGGGRFVRGSNTAGQQGGTFEHTHVLNVVVDGSSYANITQTVINIDDHSVSDLDHGHNLEPQTAKDQGISGSTFVPVFAPCTIDAPFAGHSDGHVGTGSSTIDDCPTSAWGPLTHSFSVDSGAASAYSDAFANSYIASASHIPEYTTLIFIERIDNSI